MLGAFDPEFQVPSEPKKELKNSNPSPWFSCCLLYTNIASNWSALKGLNKLISPGFSSEFRITHHRRLPQSDLCAGPPVMASASPSLNRSHQPEHLVRRGERESAKAASKAIILVARSGRSTWSWSRQTGSKGHTCTPLQLVRRSQLSAFLFFHFYFTGWRAWAEQLRAWDFHAKRARF